MTDIRFVCQYPQGKYCGNSHCPLSHYCSELPKVNISFHSQMKFGKRNKMNGISKTENEKITHHKLYIFYNRIFGDLRAKQIAYKKIYYIKNREQILKSKQKTVSHHLLCVQKCEYNCESCPYGDCIVPIPKTRKEYMDLYYKINRQKILSKKAEYRAAHRSYLANSEKLRNYRKKGYIMSPCVLKGTTNPDYEKYEGTPGVLSIIPINGNDYISFISLDREFSFRSKIDKRLNDLSNPLCQKAYYLDYDGFNYTFESTVHSLRKIENNDNFERCSNDN